MLRSLVGSEMCIRDRYDATTDPDNPAWVNASLPDMASGRLVFNDDTDNIAGGTATVTHFIRNVADPDTNTVVLGLLLIILRQFQVIS